MPTQPRETIAGLWIK